MPFYLITFQMVTFNKTQNTGLIILRISQLHVSVPIRSVIRLLHMSCTLKFKSAYCNMHLTFVNPCIVIKL